ncbi:unnamed protein product [Notodromas monacha]|uniref:STAS domain-containing protein n=1 Tax=Notodromas monacha TaxID=399045 RepID=A0A7R9GK77_9CRUS|nr:unnamed protein product [Notodromas monacha]CAG0924462.1 unnamed protein product [Notodromas monacha]
MSSDPVMSVAYLRRRSQDGELAEIASRQSEYGGSGGGGGPLNNTMEESAPSSNSLRIFGGGCDGVGTPLGTRCWNAVRKRVPVLTCPTRYSLKDFWADFLAGILTGIPCIPQGIIYAEIANLPIQYGLYAGFIGPFIYAIFGTVKELHVGPVAAIAVLIAGVTAKASPAFAVVYTTLLCLAFGIFSFLVGLLKLGWMVELVSVPVTSGLVSAAAIIVMLCNIKTFLGFNHFRGQTLTTLLPKFYESMDKIVYGDLIMGIASVIALHLMQDSIKIQWGKITPNKFISKTLSIICKTISLGRTPLLTTMCGYTAYYLNVHRPEQLITTAKAVDILGIPKPSIPAFTWPARNETIDGITSEQPQLDFLGILTYGGSTPLIVLIICLVQQSLISKNFRRAEGVNVNHELMSLGVIQVASSFFGSMPVTGAFIRSSAMAAQGVRTRFGVIWAGLMVLFALHVLTPYVEYDPKPSLAAIVFCAVFHLIQRDDIMRIWKTNRMDMIPFAATFVTSLLAGLQAGFCTGVATNIFMLLVVASDPDICIENDPHRNVTIIKPDRSMHYPGAEKLRRAICDTALLDHPPGVVAVDCSALVDMDYSTVKRLGSTVLGLKMARGTRVVFINVKPKVEQALHGFTDGAVETYPYDLEKLLMQSGSVDNLTVSGSIETIDSVVVANSSTDEEVINLQKGTNNPVD